MPEPALYHVSALMIYPVKSLGGIQLQQSEAEQEGLRYDRRWMLIDANNRFITQRELHMLCLFRMEMLAGGFRITHDSHPQQEYELPFDAYSDERLQVKVWDDTISAAAVSRHADEWFSDMLGQTCRLVRMTPDTQRVADPRYALAGEHTSFSDAFPVLILGEASLQALNDRLEMPVLMDRFRPNLVFSGGAAFDEDSWKELRIGNAALRVVKPCARCVVTTIDQQTAASGKEPLRTLARFRNVGNKILFGQDALITGNGLIRVGDPIHFA